jgi:hypothetical protein
VTIKIDASMYHELRCKNDGVLIGFIRQQYHVKHEYLCPNCYVTFIKVNSPYVKIEGTTTTTTTNKRLYGHTKKGLWLVSDTKKEDTSDTSVHLNKEGDIIE